jgi:hypothetical protein
MSNTFIVVTVFSFFPCSSFLLYGICYYNYEQKNETQNSQENMLTATRTRHARNVESRINRFSDFIHRPDSEELDNKNTMFRKLDLFPSSGVFIF